MIPASGGFVNCRCEEGGRETGEPGRKLVALVSELGTQELSWKTIHIIIFLYIADLRIFLQ